MGYRPCSEQIFQTIRRWPPEYIPYNSPFLGCLISGPAAVHLRVAKEMRKTANAQGESVCTEVDVLILALTNIAKFWKIGSILLGEASVLVLYSSTADISHKNSPIW
jgi:hypothetical protein